MITPALTIERASARMRLPASQLGRRAALERVHERIVREALELALADECGREELICVRSLAIRLRLDPRGSEQIWTEHWLATLRAELRERLRIADPREAVRYPTPLAALIDLGQGLARGDRRRAWAWVQLGLVSGEGLTAPEQLERGRIRAGLVASLRRRPELIVAVMVGLSRVLLGRQLLALLEPPHWIALADAALRVHGVAMDASVSMLGSRASRGPARVLSPDIDSEAAHESTPAGEASGDAGSSTLRERESRLADRVELLIATAKRSLLATPLRELLDDEVIDEARFGQARALLILALLDAAPQRASKLRGPLADQALVRVLVRLGAQLTQPAPEPARPHARGQATRARAVANQDQPSYGDGHGDGHAEGYAAVTSTDADEIADLDPMEHPAPTQPPASEPPSPTPWRDAILDVRPRGHSAWGGLLFTLVLLRDEQLFLVIAILAGQLDLEPRAVLHELGRILVGPSITPADPALLAFVGLPPDERPPLLQLGPDQRAQLDQGLQPVRAQLLVALEQRLPARPDRPSRGPALLAWLLRRRALVIGERGWLEIHLDPREVDTDIRRAGLDLDPNWLPALGVVMRFAYG